MLEHTNLEIPEALMKIFKVEQPIELSFFHKYTLQKIFSSSHNNRYQKAKNCPIYFPFILLTDQLWYWNDFKLSFPLTKEM